MSIHQYNTGPSRKEIQKLSDQEKLELNNMMDKELLSTLNSRDNGEVSRSRISRNKEKEYIEVEFGYKYVTHTVKIPTKIASLSDSFFYNANSYYEKGRGMCVKYGGPCPVISYLTNNDEMIIDHLIDKKISEIEQIRFPKKNNYFRL